jgi:hypothetical protein
MSVVLSILVILLYVLLFVLGAALWLGLCYWLGGGLGVLIGIGFWGIDSTIRAGRERST